jgi:hypothetical protein
VPHAIFTIDDTQKPWRNLLSLRRQSPEHCLLAQHIYESSTGQSVVLKLILAGARLYGVLPMDAEFKALLFRASGQAPIGLEKPVSFAVAPVQAESPKPASSYQGGNGVAYQAPIDDLNSQLFGLSVPDDAENDELAG